MQHVFLLMQGVNVEPRLGLTHYYFEFNEPRLHNFKKRTKMLVFEKSQEAASCGAEVLLQVQKARRSLRRPEDRGCSPLQLQRDYNTIFKSGVSK
jgi:hypothetical protein